MSKPTDHFPQSQPPRNLLEFLSARRVPDAALTILLALGAAVTLAPYLGGRSLWTLGGSTAAIPNISELQFWSFVVLAPFFWSLIVARIIGAPIRTLLAALLLGASVALLCVFVHSRWLSFGLTAIESNYFEDHRIEAWSLDAEHVDGTYRYFRTAPLALKVSRGCALRVERLEFLGGGTAFVQKKNAAFDLQIFIGTADLLPSTFQAPQSMENHHVVKIGGLEELKREPSEAAVRARAVVAIRSSDLEASDSHVSIQLVFDLPQRLTEVRPAQASKKKTEHADIIVRDQKAHLQVVGWTLYGDNVGLRINDPMVRISGRQNCALV